MSVRVISDECTSYFVRHPAPARSTPFGPNRSRHGPGPRHHRMASVRGGTGSGVPAPAPGPVPVPVAVAVPVGSHSRGAGQRIADFSNEARLYVLSVTHGSSVNAQRPKVS